MKIHDPHFHVVRHAQQTITIVELLGFFNACIPSLASTIILKECFSLHAKQKRETEKQMKANIMKQQKHFGDYGKLRSGSYFIQECIKLCKKFVARRIVIVL